MTIQSMTIAAQGALAFGRAAVFCGLLALSVTLAWLSAASAQDAPLSPMNQAEVWAAGMTDSGAVDCAAARSWIIFLPNGFLLAVEGPKIYYGSWVTDHNGITIKSTGSGLRNDSSSGLWSIDEEPHEARTIRLRVIGDGKMAATVHSDDDGILVHCDNPPAFTLP